MNCYGEKAANFRLFSPVFGFSFSQQNFIKIQKSLLLFYDSTKLEPVVHQIPYGEIVERVLNLTYKTPVSSK